MGAAKSEAYIKEFIKKMPKLELHAHLNGSLSKSTVAKLCKMAGRATNNIATSLSPTSSSLSECFKTFDLIHSITCNSAAICTATEDVITDFYNDGVRYLELRSTPREVQGCMTQSSYVDAVLLAIKNCKEKLPGITVKLLLAINRKNLVSAAEETVKIAEAHLTCNSPIVGIDFSGDPTAGDVRSFIPILQYAKKAGLKLALHIAETPGMDKEVEQLLELEPDRIGHGTFIHPQKGGSEANFNKLLKLRAPLEVCLTSNLISHTVSSYKEHHFPLWRKLDYPCVLCTDDKGVFNTSLSEEYILAQKHFDLTAKDLWEMSYNSIDFTFAPSNEKEDLKNLWKKLEAGVFNLIPEEFQNL